jgi:hypothetical protein
MALRATRSAVGTNPTISNPERALHAVVETLLNADEGYTQASSLLVAHFRQALSSLPQEEKLQYLVGLGRTAFTKMIDAQLSNPLHGNIRFNGDNTMHTVFGVRGEVKEVGLRLVKGKLSRRLEKHLEEAHNDYEAKKGDLRDGRAIQEDKVFEVQLRDGRVDRTFKATTASLKEAYLKALLGYAAVDYADRVRAERPPALKA